MVPHSNLLEQEDMLKLYIEMEQKYPMNIFNIVTAHLAWANLGVQHGEFVRKKAN